MDIENENPENSSSTFLCVRFLTAFLKQGVHCVILLLIIDPPIVAFPSSFQSRQHSGVWALYLRHLPKNMQQRLQFPVGFATLF